MKTKSDQRAGLWELAVLAVLREGPMHPYEMQRLLRERHKVELLVLKRGFLYNAINRLLRLKLIEALEIGRNGRRPERTTYRITPEGQQRLIGWLREMVAIPVVEPSEFMACVSFLIHLDPDDAIKQLDERARRLQSEIDGLRDTIKALVARVTRINLLETEYLIALRRAELKWVRGLVDELRSGQLTWDLEKIFEAVRAAREPAATTKE